MIAQLFKDLRSYFEGKTKCTEQERNLLLRLNSGFFPITSVHRDDLASHGYDVKEISDSDMEMLATKMAEDYITQLFNESLVDIADEMVIPQTHACPKCDDDRTLYDSSSQTYRCHCCKQEWQENLYVLTEFPDDTTFFDENDIGYPSFESEDNGARYVPEAEYIRHFKKDPPQNAYFMPKQWPESQPYLYPDEPNDSTDTLCEPINDEKGRADFGEQAVWVPLCNLKN